MPASSKPALPESYRLIDFDTVDSTNAEALRRMRLGVGDGTVIWSREQTKGRGRRGRDWLSGEGNLYMTIVVSGAGMENAGHLSLVTAVAVGNALARVGADPRYKWPNDILLGGKKAGGILIEAASGMFAVGLGLNLLTAPKSDGFVATSFSAETHKRWDPANAVRALIWSFDAACKRLAESGFEPIRGDWIARAHGIGEPVTARLPKSSVKGTFLGIDAEGGLILETEPGKTRTITAGEIYFGAERP